MSIFSEKGTPRITSGALKYDVIKTIGSVINSVINSLINSFIMEDN